MRRSSSIAAVMFCDLAAKLLWRFPTGRTSRQGREPPGGARKGSPREGARTMEGKADAKTRSGLDVLVAGAGYVGL
ncbi:hypothetical protein EN746_33880, partial [Mesorhizobium sp. M8A.F.Ca.ET.023.02.2.1]